MKLEDLHIGVSPLTDTIYLGTVSKRDRGAWASKVDCTSKFIGALMDWTPHHPSDIASDPEGRAIVDDDAPLRAAIDAAK